MRTYGQCIDVKDHSMKARIAYCVIHMIGPLMYVYRCDARALSGVSTTRCTEYACVGAQTIGVSAEVVTSLGYKAGWMNHMYTKGVV